MMAEGALPVRDITRRMGVSVATLYRHTGKRGRIVNHQHHGPDQDHGHFPHQEYLADLFGLRSRGQ